MQKTATLLDRTKASTIDILLLILAGAFATLALSYFENVPIGVRQSIFIALVLYEPVFIIFGGTVGDRLMNIRVRKSANESKNINILQSLIRFIFKLTFGWFSYISIFKNPRKRTLHDLISMTSVVTIKHSL
ncbi:RDD family protein [Flavobacterium pallidum]|uniref:RDD family protein n=1 Tax=Flavobacterium pallidum TaxID=2172098 RepID=A0A2S1SKI1_9FLAO|nr:RDD family protein [Flavobacterium pallidum]AWI26856.1 RDD family protein [Flavobacterium pallidum]